MLCDETEDNIFIFFTQLKPNLDKEKDPMAGIMDLMKVTLLPEL